MLEKPDLPEEQILRHLKTEYGLLISTVEFLPLGADMYTAVYRVGAIDGSVYFLKFRSGVFLKASVLVPNYLHEAGLKEIIPALPALTGALWAELPPYKTILYPFISGQHGYERPLTKPQWLAFGKALNQFHSTPIPAYLTIDVPRETFHTRWCSSVREILYQLDPSKYSDDTTREAAAFLQDRSDETFDLINRTESLVFQVKKENSPFCLCHGDIHAWNLLVKDENTFYMIDWDTLIFAPRERDLMFIGGSLGGNFFSPQEEEALFFSGYGQTNLSRALLAYYRYIRILEDITIFCEQIFSQNTPAKDRDQALIYLMSNYLPGNVMDAARNSEIS